MYMKIYCDGSCINNPGSGGWAFLYITQDEDDQKDIIYKESYGSEDNTTNNRMELLAVIKSLEALHQEKLCEKIHIYCDSKYVIQGATSWLYNWKKTGWKNSKKQSVKNQDLWERVDALLIYFEKSIKIAWHWVPAHEGYKYNEIVDKLARAAAEGVNL